MILRSWFEKCASRCALRERSVATEENARVSRRSKHTDDQTKAEERERPSVRTRTYACVCVFVRV